MKTTKPILSFDKMEVISKTDFSKFFAKSILQLSLKNAVNLLDMQIGKVHQDTLYIKNY